MKTEEKAANPEDRWIRLQEVGLILLLSIPAFLVGWVFITGDTMWGFDGQQFLNFYVLGGLVVGIAGIVCLQYGQTKRRELQGKETIE
jgi:hypothetical protein